LRDVGEQASLLALARGSAPVVEVGGGSPRLSDEDYRALLQRSSAVVLSIRNGVASNAVLEAASAAKPVLGHLSADLQTHVSEANRELLTLPAKAQLGLSPADLAAVGRENRAHVLARHSWP